MLAAALGGFLANIYGFKNIICNYVSIIFVWFVISMLLIVRKKKK